MATQSDLIADLEALRDELGLSNEKFAALVDLDPVTWSLMRRGIRGVSAGALVRIVRKRPEFLPHLLAA